MISGSWRATDGLLLAPVFGASGSCATGSIPSIGWLESVAGYSATDNGWKLVDTTGSAVAFLTIDGAPKPIASAAEFYTQVPKVTIQTRAYFADAAPLPAALTPGILEGRPKGSTPPRELVSSSPPTGRGRDPTGVTVAPVVGLPMRVAGFWQRLAHRL